MGDDLAATSATTTSFFPVHARRRQDMHVVHHPSEHILITKAVFVPVEEIFEGVERLVVHSLVKISTTDVC